MNAMQHRWQDTAPTACALCGNRADNGAFWAEEMMFGTRTRARYLECGACGCVQLISPLPDMAMAYPPDYYSLQTPTVKANRTMRLAKSVRAAVALRLPVRIVESLVARKQLREHFVWFAGLEIHLHSSILDVGSGNGAFCAELYAEGFHDVTGIDPSVPRDVELMPGFWIYRGEIDRLTRRYELITMNHSLEHVPDQHAILRAIGARLTPGGALLIRIPIADSDAWQRYGADWVSLDPPRHFFIHTEQSFTRVAAECGFEVVRTFRDSVGLQFWGSEQYRRGIPLMSTQSVFRNPSASTFSKRELANFEAEAERLNCEGRGDWAGFVLRPITPGDGPTRIRQPG